MDDNLDLSKELEEWDIGPENHPDLIKELEEWDPRSIEIFGDNLENLNIASVDGSAVNPDNYGDRELIEDRLNIENYILIIAETVSELQEMQSHSDNQRNKEFDAHQYVLLQKLSDAIEAQKQYYDLVIIETLRTRLRSTDTDSAFLSEVGENSPETTDWDILSQFVYKLNKLANLYGIEKALDHLEDRIGAGPITAVDRSTVTRISTAVDPSMDVDLSQSLSASQAAIEQRLVEISDLSIDIDQGDLDNALDELKSDIDIQDTDNLPLDEIGITYDTDE